MASSSRRPHLAGDLVCGSPRGPTRSATGWSRRGRWGTGCTRSPSTRTGGRGSAKAGAEGGRRCKGSGDAADGDGPAEWELWDLSRPLEGDCELQLHKFDDDKGKEVFWHSTAHILGEALESLYGARLTHGPPTDGGFFYDSFMGANSVTPEMTSALEKKVKQIADAKQDYERIVVTKEECLQLFEQVSCGSVAARRAWLPPGRTIPLESQGEPTLPAAPRCILPLLPPSSPHSRALHLDTPNCSRLLRHPAAVSRRRHTAPRVAAECRRCERHGGAACP